MVGRHKPRFLFVSAPFSGIEVFMKNFQQIISDRNDIDSTWLYIDWEPKDFIARIPLISKSWPLKATLAVRSRVHSLEKSGKRFDAAFFNHLFPVCFLNEFRRRVPYIISIDATPPLLNRYGTWYKHRSFASRFRLLHRLWHKQVRSVYMDAAYLMPWSAWVQESLMAHYAIGQDKIIIVPPGINVRLWGKTAGKRRSVKESSSKIKILFVGGEFKRKGGDLIHKISQRDEFKTCEFHLVTKSFPGTGGENLFVYQNLQPNGKRIRTLYHEADIFVLPTQADLSPLAIHEAMAMGLPVVCTNVGGISEIVNDGTDGFVVPVNDEEAFAKRLKKLVRNADLRFTMGQNARKKVHTQFNLEKNAALIIEYLKKLSNRKAA